MNIKLKNIQRFTMTLGIGGTIIATLGAGFIGGNLLFKHMYPNKLYDTIEPTIETTFKYGGIAIATGLLTTGLAVGIAKHVGENLPDIGENLPDIYYIEEIKGFTEDEEKYLAHTQKCNNCKYFHGIQYYSTDLICAVHPSGVSESICPDWEKKRD